MKKRKRRRAAPARLDCPCGSETPYAACCQPLHHGEREAKTPVELVRARFSAFATGQSGFLWDTLHSSHDDRDGGREAFLSTVTRTATVVQYRSLRILDQSEPDAHGVAQVLFAIGAGQHKRDLSFVEQSDFVREDGLWRYIVGIARPLSELTHPVDQMSLGHWLCAHQH